MLFQTGCSFRWLLQSILKIKQESSKQRNKISKTSPLRWERPWNPMPLRSSLHLLSLSSKSNLSCGPLCILPNGRRLSREAPHETRGRAEGLLDPSGGHHKLQLPSI